MIKSLSSVLVVAVALIFTGCEKSSEKGGGPAKDTFRIIVPAMASDVNQGELVTVRVTLERTAAFKQRVKLEVKALAGIQIEPATTTVEPGDPGDFQLKITAAKDAAIGEHKIFVKGTPDQGEPTQTEFKINVRAK